MEQRKVNVKCALKKKYLYTEMKKKGLTRVNVISKDL